MRAPDPLDAAALEVEPPDADAAADDDDDELDEHPAIRAAAAATATAPTAMRARSNLTMFLTAPFREKGPSSRSALIQPRSAEQTVPRTGVRIKI
jgi:hypothetical protein